MSHRQKALSIHDFVSHALAAVMAVSLLNPALPMMAADFQDVDTVDIYRLYNPNTGEHFYTQDVHERDVLVADGWKYEGIGWRSWLDGDPVYRLYNPNAIGGDHYYTISAPEARSLVNQGGPKAAPIITRPA